MKVLIADDDRVLTHLMAGRLRAKGWHVTVAHDAMQALMFAMRTAPDAIILDIHMPGGTGMSALEKLKASVKTSEIPVVVVSGSIQPEDAPKLIALGAEACLGKPVDIEELDAVLQRLVGAPEARA